MVGVCGVSDSRRASCVCVCLNSSRRFSSSEAALYVITDDDVIILPIGESQRVA